MTDLSEPELLDLPPDPGREPGSRRWAVAVAILVLGAAAVFGGRLLAEWVGEAVDRVGNEVRAPDVPAGQPVTVEVPAGSSARDIGALLATAAVVQSSTEFEARAREVGVADQLQAGTYELTTGMSLDDAVEVLAAGPSDNTYWVTIREGLRIDEILQSLAEQSPHTVSSYRQALLSGSVTSSLMPADLPIDDVRRWEGLLFPDTYRFGAEASPAAVLGLLASTMEDRVAAVDWSETTVRGLTKYEGVVVASLIESEAAVDHDRPLISSVIYNRLELPMPLQIDATVLYAMGERGISLTFADLEVDSPYNTYRIDGLPPTPIGTPGLASLRAAAQPAETDYLYYVLSSLDGSHTFSETLEEHDRAVQKAREEGVLP